MFLCYLQDLERNDGSSFRPYVMSRNMRVLMRKMENRRSSDRVVEVRPTVFTVEEAQKA